MKKSLTIFALLLSLSFQLVAQKTWTGATSVAWNTSTNWNPVGVPVATDDVIIPSGLTNYPVVTGTTGGTCKDLTLNIGASMSVSGSGSNTVLDITGTTTFNGSVSIGGSISTTGKIIVKNVQWNPTASFNPLFGARFEVSGNWYFTASSEISCSPQFSLSDNLLVFISSGLSPAIRYLYQKS